MSFDRNGFPDAEAHALYSWWENELNGETRTLLMNGYTWMGTQQERLNKLKEMRSKWDSLGCPHCGSKTKHESWCPDQQIINTFKELKSLASDTKRREDP